MNFGSHFSKSIKYYFLQDNKKIKRQTIKLEIINYRSLNKIFFQMRLNLVVESSNRSQTVNRQQATIKHRRKVEDFSTETVNCLIVMFCLNGCLFSIYLNSLCFSLLYVLCAFCSIYLIRFCVARCILCYSCLFLFIVRL